MKKRPFENRVIIIGADHHNTLAAIRAFGREGCEIAVVIHGHALVRNKIQVFSSRYINHKQAFVIENDDNELLKVLEQYGNKKQKAILFPSSDFAEYVIDSNYEALSARFICPGFAGKPGEVCRMMDKWNQYLFAKEHDIPMAPTFLIDTYHPVVPPELMLPCIVKPRISAMGSKTDIAICEDKQALLDTVAEYRKNGYSDCLAQMFIKKEYEANALGFVLVTDQTKACIGAVAVKLREQLESATSYAVFVSDVASDEVMEGFGEQALLDANCRVLQALEADGYSGQYDIDYLRSNDTVYLNEINYRQSGNGYTLVNEKMNAPVLWTRGMLGDPDVRVPTQCVEIGSHFMAELIDMIYIKRRQLTLRQWIHDIRGTASFAVYDSRDLKATGRYYKDRLIGLAKKTIVAIAKRR